MQETWLAIVDRDRPFRGKIGARHVDLLDPHQPGQDPQRARAPGGAVLIDRAGRRRGAGGRSRSLPEGRRGLARSLGHAAATLAETGATAALARGPRAPQGRRWPQLPERQRVIVGLRDIEGRSAEEVCESARAQPGEPAGAAAPWAFATARRRSRRTSTARTRNELAGRETQPGGRLASRPHNGHSASDFSVTASTRSPARSSSSSSPTTSRERSAPRTH